MKKQCFVLLSTFIVLLLFSQLVFAGCSENCKCSPFVGKWALYLPSGGGSWLQVHQKDGYLEAEILWRWGSVTPASGILMEGKKLVVQRTRKVVRKKNEDGKIIKEDQITDWFEFELVEKNKLLGKAMATDWQGEKIETMNFIGIKNSCLPEAPNLKKIKYGKAVKLFNGKDLTGWKLIEKNAQNGFSVINGVMVNNPVQKEGKAHIHYGNIRTEKEFEDFNLKLEVNIPKGSNSGIYLRGLYEIQVLDSYEKKLDSHHMGALYSRIVPSVNAEKPAGEWQSVDITLCNRHVTVILNGTKIIDNQPVEGITGGALTPNEFKPGPIYFQGDHGKVSYRNIVLKPIIKK